MSDATPATEPVSVGAMAPAVGAMAPAVGARVLVVDDVAELRQLARVALERRGFSVEEAADGETAVARVRSGAVDLLVLDVNLPGMSGLAVLTLVRQQAALPVILLTGLRDEADRVLGLELGADDYVVKPFSPTELGARATAVLRRSAPGPAPATAPPAPAPVPPAPPAPDPSGVIVVADQRQVLVGGSAVDLTPKEFDLLTCLVAAPRRVFSRAELLEQVWGSALGWQDPATVTEHVRRLRRKIEADPERPRWLQTVRGIGYRYVPAG